jgi:hypothetical protein
MSDLPCAWRADTRPTSSAAGPFCLSGLDACAVERFRRAAHARADSVWAVPQVVVVLLLLVVFAVDLPVVPGAAVVGAFALLHGHAHGSEVAETGGLAHMAGFVLATFTVPGLGIAFAVSARHVRWGSFGVRRAVSRARARLPSRRQSGDETVSLCQCGSAHALCLSRRCSSPDPQSDSR